MTSEERRAAGYKRRKATRAAKRAERCPGCDDFDVVFSYRNLYRAYQISRRGVAWKSSVQKYITQAPLHVWNTYDRLRRGTFKTSGFFEFDIRERGKLRHIRSVTIGERVVQRCLCDNALVPMITRTFIYDNGAAMEGKGYSFAIRRMCKHLQEHYRRHGADGYILLFDFRKFFDRVSHRVVKGILRNEFTDARLIKLTEHFVDAFGDVGLGLGSQISQVFALASGSRLDHYVKEVCRVKGYGRYMDDGYLIHPSKEYLKKCLAGIRVICQELEITLNEKKTQIAPLRHGFTFLKVRFFLTDTGRIVKKVYRKSVTKMRRKLKALRRMLDQGRVEYADVYASWQSWKSYAQQFDAYKTIESMGKLYDDLFVNEWLTPA